MNDDAATLQLFDPASMAGVAPGARTQIMQRVRLMPIGSAPQASAHGSASAERRRWARLLWVAGAEDAAVDCAVYLRAKGGGIVWEDEPLLVLQGVRRASINALLQERLALVGWRPRVCGSCRWWRPDATENADGLPTGACTWRVDGAPAEIPARLRRQSALALDCPAWQHAEKASEPEPTRPENEVATSFLQRIWHRFSGRSGSTDKVEPLAERSGMGAGTEACFACQGRIANLGAVSVETSDGDDQTFSLWRCRSCYGLYLNDWIDRWKRLDSLETEESYYRLAPAAAAQVLAAIEARPGGDSSAGRRGWFQRFVADRPRLSHQIRQGR